MKYVLLSLLVLLSTRAAALTYMPDANLRAWCNSWFPGCIVGTEIDETHPAVMAATEIHILGGEIQNVTGLSAFTNVTLLDLSNLPLGMVDDFPPQVREVMVTNCQLTSFSGPIALRYLNVSHNLLTTLDLGWNTELTQLNCSHNLLTSITGLPSADFNLGLINCSYNLLTTMPDMPYLCSMLDISHNRLTQMPSLSSNIGGLTINASHNLIQEVTVWSTQNHVVDLRYNQIDSFPPYLSGQLRYLYLSNNPLTKGIAAIPISTQVLWVDSTQMPCLPYLSRNLTQLRCRNNTFSCLPNQPPGLAMVQADFGFTPAVCGVTFACYMPEPSLALKIFLQGPFDFDTYRMNDDLRAQGLLPNTEPYTAMGYTYHGPGWSDTFDPAVLNVTGDDAIVDWVVVEMRPDMGSLQNGNALLYSRPALVQRDGDIVGLDGSWPLVMKMNHGRYQSAIRHRNHLGVIQRFGEWHDSSTRTIDFTDWIATICFPSAMHGDSSFDDNRQLWSGDVNFNQQLKYTGADNDRDIILEAIGGSVPTNTLTGVYHQADVNMDGVVKYTGTRNDRDPILQNIGGTVPTNIRSQIGF